jgi:1-acyl-sn-glycerol-3-phosphate acyltransferase
MTDWHYEPAPDLNRTFIERLREFPRQPDLLCYGLRSVAALALRAWLRTYHRLTISGWENLPCEESFVMVANHTSHLDALCLLSALPLRRLHRAFPAAAADYFFVSLPRLAVSAVVINALPFHRELHVRQSLRLCRKLLSNRGSILILFPEGTRGDGREVGAFKHGIGTLLAGSDTPAVPCYLDGAAGALPKGSWIPRPWPIHLSIGKPLTFEHRGTDKQAIQNVCAELRQAVRSLATRPRRAGDGAIQPVTSVVH